MCKERVLGLAGSVLLLASMNVACSKSNRSDPSFWTEPAGSHEQLSPAFSDSARKLLAAIELERQNVGEADAGFGLFQSASWKIRDDAAKQIHTRRDRDLYYLLQGYEQKVGLTHTVSTNRDGAKYLPALREQVQSCHDEMQQLFATRPVRNPPVLPSANEPCTEPVPSTQ